jgi:long-chain acyl-CoA synthetase
MFHHFMAWPRCGADILDGKPVSFGDRCSYWLGNLLVYGPLKNVLGMSRIRVAYTAGAAIGPTCSASTARSASTSSSSTARPKPAPTSACSPTARSSSTVGKPAPGVEVKIADNGEILVKGPMLLKAYYKRPDATAESINADGYFMTGDAGFFDDDGHLKIIDRAKDVGKLANGAMFAPNYIENKLKFFQHIKEAVLRRRREMVTAFINIDSVRSATGPSGAASPIRAIPTWPRKPEVYELIQECVEKVNADLAPTPTWPIRRSIAS